MNALTDVASMPRDRRVALADACRSALDSLGVFLSLVESDPTIMATLRDSASPLALPADGGASNVVAVDFRPAETVEIETVPAVEVEPETRERLVALESGVAAVEAALAVAEPEPVDPAIAAMNAAAADITADHFPEGYNWPKAAYSATLPRAAFAAALAIACEAVERRNTIPILCNVLLRATAPDRIEIVSTDLDMEITIPVECTVDEGFACTVHASTFRDVIGKSKADTVELCHKVIDERLAITLGGARSALATLPATDFPALQADKKDAIGFTLDNDVFCTALARVGLAISTEETRRYLNGVFLHVYRTGPASPATLRMVATDGHRLGCTDLPVPVAGRLADMPGAILPRKLVAVAGKLFAPKGKGKKREAATPVHVAVNATKAWISSGGIRIVSKLIDGAFPDYNRVVPAANDKRLAVDHGEFAEAVSRVSTISTERGRAFKMDIEEGNVRLTVVNPDSGTITETVGANWTAEPLSIGFNSRYMLEIFGQLRGVTTVTMDMADPGSPTVIKSPERDGLFYVLMPMRV